jgi:hypothetical protein
LRSGRQGLLRSFRVSFSFFLIIVITVVALWVD